MRPRDMVPQSREASITSTTGGNSSLRTRIILLGDHGIGKSAFLASIIQGDGVEMVKKKKARNPFQASGCTKKMRIGEQDVDVILQDTAGQERYRSLTSSYYRGANGCLLFFNVHSQSSFDNLSIWLEDVFRYCPEENPAIILVGVTNRLYKTGESAFSLRNKHNVTNKHRNKVKGIPDHLTSNNVDDCSSDTLHQMKYSDYHRRPLTQTNRQLLGDDISLADHPTLSYSFYNSGTSSSLNNDCNDTDRSTDNTHNHKTPQTVSKKSLASKECDNPIPPKNGLLHFYKHKQTGYNSVSDNNHNEVERNDGAEMDDGKCSCKRVISEEKAQSFAYAHEIPYREVDLENWSSIENVLNRAIDATIHKNRRSSLLLPASDSASPAVLFIRPSQKDQQGFIKTCCSCFKF